MQAEDILSPESDFGEVVCMGVTVPHSPFLNETRVERIRAARYEGQEIAGALKVVGPEDRVIEMGAGLGIVGGVIAHNNKPAEIRSYEANPDLIPHIQELYAENNLTDRISVTNQVLLSAPDRPESVTFYLRNSFLGSSLLDSDKRKTREIHVPTADFNALAADFRPTVLVIDIEGGELELLEHADLTGVRAIVIEFHPESYQIAGMKKCKNILRDAGFKPDADVSTRTVWTCTRELSE